MVKIDLRNWKVIDGDAEPQAPAPVITAEASPPVPAEAPQNPVEATNSPVVELHPPRMPQAVGAPLPMVQDDIPEEGAGEDDTPELDLVLTFPVAIVNVQAVRNGDPVRGADGKSAAYVYEFDMKMRVSSADASHVFSKIMGHICLASFKSPTDGDL